VQVPADISLRVAAPARIVTADALQAERQAAQQRLEAEFQQAIAMSAGWQQDRVRTFLASRRSGATPAADQAVARALTTLGDPLPSPLFLVAADGVDGAVAGRLTIRAVRQRDPTTRGRAIATLSLLACGGLAWIAAGAAAAAIRAWLRPRQTAAEPPAAMDIAEATTIYRR
jgi:hypothetical protein